MAFDPDQYLAAKGLAPAGGFDPDAYISAKGLTEQAPEYSPAETVGLNASNVFGLAPVAVGAYGALAHGANYAAGRDAHRAAIEAANEQNPISGWVGKGLSLIPETVIGGGVGKVASLGIKGAMGAKALSTAARLGAESPTLAAIGKGALGGAAYGAASGAGEAASRGDSVLAGGAEGAAGGAVAGGVLGGVLGKAGKILGKAGEREEADILRGVAAGEGTAGRATPTVSKRLVAKQSDVIDVLRGDPELLRASRKPASEALPVFRARLEDVGSRLDPEYQKIDKATGGVSVRGLVEHLNDEIKRMAGDPLNEVYTGGLAKIRDSLIDSWAPQMKDAQKIIEDLQRQGVKKIPPGVLPADVYVPTRELRKVVTRLQTRAVDIINGLNPGESSKAKAEFAGILKGYIDDHLSTVAGDKVAGPAAVAIKALNKKYSALATMLTAVEQRGWKEQTGSISGQGLAGSLLKKGSLLGAGVQLMHGHPAAAIGTLVAHKAIEHAPEIARSANATVAAVQREAMAGNPRAIRLLQAIAAGRAVGTAGAAAAGAAQTTNLAQVAGQ